jgi:probable HAF family extracellular repeat protein
MTRCISAVCILLALLLASLAAAQTYSITDLGALAAGGITAGNSINASGEVAGAASPTPQHGFVWTASQGMTSLPPLKGNFFGWANGINASGVAVGVSSIKVNGRKQYHGVVWTNGKPLDIGVLTANAESVASAINDSGQVVGAANPGSKLHATLWTKATGLQDLGTLPGGDTSAAYAINNVGQIVGASNDSSGITYGFLWSKSTGMRHLPALPGSNYTYANSINLLGQIVGSSNNSNGHLRPVLWSASGGIQDLGVLSGDYGIAEAINNNGQVVGTETAGAFIWSQASGMQDLNTRIPANSGWDIFTAAAINDSGQITGYGMIGGALHAYLLTPVN